MPRTGENIYKRKDGRWEGRYIKAKMSNGKSTYGYVYGRTYRDVKGKLHEAAVNSRTETQKPDAAEQTPEPFRKVAQIWFESVQPKVKESTGNKYRNLLNSYIIPAIGDLTLESITYDVIENMCNTLLLTGGAMGAGLSAKTVADVLSLVRRILTYASMSGKEIKCDAKSVQIKQSSGEMRVLSIREQEQLCRYLYTHNSVYSTGILVSLFTGLRIGEICALRWEDISLEERTIHVRQTIQRIQAHTGTRRKTKVVVTSPKSACSIRTIPIPDPLTEIIAAHRTNGRGFFLTNSENKFVEPRTMQNQFKKILQQSGIADAHYHTLRHTFATRCVELGFDVKSLSEILGHASVTITMNRYVHPSMELKKENMQRLSNFLTVR